MGAGKLSRKIINKETDTTVKVIINHFFVIDLNPTGSASHRKTTLRFQVPDPKLIKM
jgi:hypothetical protein